MTQILCGRPFSKFCRERLLANSGQYASSCFRAWLMPLPIRLHKAWLAGIDFAIARRESPAIAIDRAARKEAVLAQLPRCMMRPADLVAAAVPAPAPRLDIYSGSIDVRPVSLNCRRQARHDLSLGSLAALSSPSAGLPAPGLRARVARERRGHDGPVRRRSTPALSVIGASTSLITEAIEAIQMGASR